MIDYAICSQGNFDHFQKSFKWLKFYGEGERHIVCHDPRSPVKKSRLILFTFMYDGKKTRYKSSPIKIDKSGALKVNNRKFISFEIFQQAVQPIPPSGKLCQLQQYKQFAHVWGLKGSVPVGYGLSFNRTGWSTKSAAESLRDIILKLSFPDELSIDNVFSRTEIKTMISNALLGIIKFRQLRSDKKFSAAGKLLRRKLRSKTPFLIPSGYKKHAVYITYCQGILAITNRGGRHSQNRPGTYYFQVNPDALKSQCHDSEFMKKLLGKCTKKEFLSFHPSEKVLPSFEGEMTRNLGLKFLSFDLKKSQKVGNCTHANCMASLYPLVILKLIKNEEMIETYRKKLKPEYKMMTFEVKQCVLEMALQNFDVYDTEFQNDCKAVLQRMKRKSRKYLKDGQENMAAICEYYAKMMGDLIKSQL